MIDLGSGLTRYQNRNGDAKAPSEHPIVFIDLPTRTPQEIAALPKSEQVAYLVGLNLESNRLLRNAR